MLCDDGQPSVLSLSTEIGRSSRPSFASTGSVEEGEPLLRARGGQSDAVKTAFGVITDHGYAQDPNVATATPTQLMVNLITCGLGTGIFTLPWSIAGASVIPGVLIIAFVLGLNAWTMSIIVAAGERHQVFDLGGLLGKISGATGRCAQWCVNGFIWVSTYLCLVGYITMIADCLASSGYVTFIQSRASLVVLGATGVLPLCFLDQRRLAASSMLTVLTTLNIFLLIAMQSSEKRADTTQPPMCLFGLSGGSVAMCSAMMQTVVIQGCVLPMYAELRDRSPAKFNHVMKISFSALFLFFTAFSVGGYKAYGQAVHSNVILSLPSSHWGHACRLGAVFAVAGVFPIMVKPMIAPLYGLDSRSEFVPNAMILFIVFASLVGALNLDDLGYINVVNGALSCSAFVGLAPSLVGLYLSGSRSENPQWRATMYALAIIGISFSLVGMVMTDNYAGALRRKCAWPQAF